jgi:alkyl sulfatase BDS1-like metallo-beta-lactamase superfamily hydrolase
MPTQLWLDYLAILLDSEKAEGLRFVMNLVTPDNGQQFVVELSNGTLTSIEGFLAPNADVTLTIDRKDLEAVMMQKATFASQAQAGLAKVTGNPDVLKRLADCLVRFDPAFEILPGTKSTQAAGP